MHPLLDNDYNTNDDGNYNNSNINENDFLYPPLSPVIDNKDNNTDDDVAPIYANAPLEAIQQDPLDVIRNLCHDLEGETTEHLPHIDTVSIIEQDPLDVIYDPNLPPVWTLQ